MQKTKNKKKIGKKLFTNRRLFSTIYLPLQMFFFFEIKNKFKKMVSYSQSLQKLKQAWMHFEADPDRLTKDRSFWGSSAISTGPMIPSINFY